MALPLDTALSCYAQLGRSALERAEVKRLMTIPGIDATVALSLVAAIGVFRRFRTPEQLVSYLGLNPRVRQSGGKAAAHGRITKNGRAHARGMLVEAAFTASKIPGPLRAFYQRVRSRLGIQIAIVATARKLVCLRWTMIERGEDDALPDSHSPRRSCVRSSSAPACPPGAGRKARPPATRSKKSAGANANSPSRPAR